VEQYAGEATPVSRSEEHQFVALPFEHPDHPLGGVVGGECVGEDNHFGKGAAVGIQHFVAATEQGLEVGDPLTERVIIFVDIG